MELKCDTELGYYSVLRLSTSTKIVVCNLLWSMEDYRPYNFAYIIYTYKYIIPTYLLFITIRESEWLNCDN